MLKAVLARDVAAADALAEQRQPDRIDRKGHAAPQHDHGDDARSIAPGPSTAAMTSKVLASAQPASTTRRSK